MELKEFLHKYRFTNKAFAQKANLTVDQMNNAVAKRSISLIVALKIQQATHGLVQPIELISNKVKEEEGLKDELFHSF